MLTNIRIFKTTMKSIRIVRSEPQVADIIYPSAFSLTPILISLDPQNKATG